MLLDIGVAFNGVMGSKRGHEMVEVSLVVIFDEEIIYNEGEGDITGFMVEVAFKQW